MDYEVNNTIDYNTLSLNKIDSSSVTTPALCATSPQGEALGQIITHHPTPIIPSTKTTKTNYNENYTSLLSILLQRSYFF
jgi:hypothetical protein